MRTFLPTAACVLLGAGSVIAQAQTESLSGNAGQIWHGTQAGARAGQYLDLGAVSSGDSRSDLIIGAPGSSLIPGAVYVIFGGPTRTGDLSLSNADASITGAAAGDKFGYATAAGNVITAEGSQTRNLVVGAPGANGGKGVVYVFLGGFAVNSRLTTGNAGYTIVGRAGDQLGSALATADLDNDGFREIIIGAPGNDRLYVIYAQSTATNAYSVIKTVNVTVSATSLMSIDLPAAEATITSSTIGISGWAIDRAAATGTGIDAVHMYAYHNPGSGEPAIFLGVGTLGFSRPDIAALFGSQYTNSGYWLTSNRDTVGLAPGTYNLVVWAHSAATGTFNNVALVRVVIQ